MSETDNAISFSERPTSEWLFFLIMLPSSLCLIVLTDFQAFNKNLAEEPFPLNRLLI